MEKRKQRMVGQENEKLTLLRLADGGARLKPLAAALFGGDLDVAVGDLLLEVLGVLAVDGAADGDAGAEDFLDGAGEVLGHGSRPHHPGDLNDVVEGDVAVVLDVLGLLAVALRLLKGLDHQGGGRGHHRHLGLAVLHGELDGDAEALPILGRLLGDVFTNLLGGETEGTDLGRQGARRPDLTAGHADVNVNDLGGIKLGRHGSSSGGGG
ncbi:putative 60S ribosomal protein L12-like [Cocos nucifera]|uniref:Putative 60S ribosomal protein L12-like n=1 Tax=Cocos nucifera TaxID=13894 RepID=A0A8K0MXY7_COCNU|nr:putative 60S ribosomal protein L12-like [Cocos nucifera]